MPAISHVTFAAVELRIPDTSERIVEGIVVPWQETSFLTPNPKGERFMPGSLDRTTRERPAGTPLFRNHDHNVKVGKALGWRADDSAGCWGQFEIFPTDAGDAVLEEVRVGALDAFSAGFRPINTRRHRDGAIEVLEAALHEVSLVPLAAYEGARVLAMRTPWAAPGRSVLPAAPEVDLSPLPLLR
jgi:HK97 family phage prohead protease